MSQETNQTDLHPRQPVAGSGPPPRRLSILSSGAIVLLLIMILALLAWSFVISRRIARRVNEIAGQVNEIDRQVKNLDWARRIHGLDDFEDTIKPNVGTIQFLNNGFTVQLTRVSYTGEGLELEGFIGNPFMLSVWNLTVNVRADIPLYHRRDEFMRSDWVERRLFFGDSIGKAQSNLIPYMGPGQRAPFSVSIPNVTQTDKGITLRVFFSGQRYGYPQPAATTQPGF